MYSLIEESKIVRFTIISFVIVLSGCANYSAENPHDDWVMISESAEKDMGESSAEKLREKIGMYQNDTFSRYVDNVGSRVAIYSQRPDLDYKFGILDWFQINALALPGGYIYVTRGLLREISSEAQLAGILAHEVAHVAAYHAVKRRQWSVGTLLAAGVIASQTGGRGAYQSLAARQFFTLGYTRSAEREADRLGVQYASGAGYHPKGLTEFLSILQKLSGEVPDQRVLYMRTHPFLQERIQNNESEVREAMEQMSDTPLVNRRRYRRYKNKFLYRDQEQVVLNQLEQFILAYENKNLSGMQSKLDSDFKMGSDDSSDTSGEFLDEINRRFQNTKKIDYEERILDLDVSDTDARIFYQYEEKRWSPGEYVPTINEGKQEMIWRKEPQWKLIRLR